MRSDQSFDATTAATPAIRTGPRMRFGAALAAAAFIAAACTPGTGTGAGTGVASAAGSGAAAGGYPERTINMVVPFAAGGPTDTVTRLVAEPMSQTLGQQIVIQNVAGAGGTLAAGQVAAAEPDGYTVLMHHIGMSTAPTLYADLPYDPLEDFKMIGLVTEVPMTIIGAPDFEPDTMEELVAHVEENGDSVNYANAGIGAASQLCGLLFMSATDTTVTEVSYDGTGPAITDLLGGHVDFLCDQTTNTTEQIRAGEVKAYAITTPERNDALPDVPTTTEAGLPDLSVTVWHGLYVPGDTPDAIVQELSAALQAALTEQNVIDSFADLGTEPVAADQATPEAHRIKLESEIARWRPIIEAAGVSAD